jgi:uncharacterized membrane protein YbhN (UPF0104 family)
MIKKILKKTYLLIGPLLFIWIMKDINFSQFKEAIPSINVFYYFAAIFFWLPITYLKSYRWKIIMDVQKINYSLKNAFLMYGASSLLGLATPGKLGEFSKIAYLKKDNHSLGRAALGSFLDKFFDLFFVLILSILAFFFLPLLPQISINYSALIKWVSIAILIFIPLFLIFYTKYKDVLWKFLLEIIDDLRQFKTRELFTISFITITEWLIYFILMYLIAISAGLSALVGFFYLSFSSAILLIAGFLPISVLNIGTREAILLFLLAPFGISREMIVLFSLLVMFNYIGLLLIGLYCWFKKPLV